MEQPSTKLKVRLRSITLSRDSLRGLLEIVAKAGADDPDADVKFEFEGKDEAVAGRSIDAVVNSRLPRDLRGMLLEACSKHCSRRIRFRVSNIGGGSVTSAIEVEAEDIDWVNARVREMEDFMADHGNFHWVFDNPGLLLLGSAAFGVVVWLSVRGELWGGVLGMFSGFLYFALVRVLFPIVVLDTERRSSVKVVRKVVIGVVTAVFVGLVANLVVRAVMNVWNVGI